MPERPAKITEAQLAVRPPQLRRAYVVTLVGVVNEQDTVRFRQIQKIIEDIQKEKGVTPFDTPLPHNSLRELVRGLSKDGLVQENEGEDPELRLTSRGGILVSLLPEREVLERLLFSAPNPEARRKL